MRDQYTWQQPHILIKKVLPDNLMLIIVPENLFLYNKAYSRVVGGDGAGGLRSGREFARFPPPQNLPTHQISSSEARTQSKPS
jgi:hypothetical protein